MAIEGFFMHDYSVAIFSLIIVLVLGSVTMIKMAHDTELNVKNNTKRFWLTF